MAKIITGKDGPVLGIYSSKDMFDKLKYESSQLENDFRNPYIAFNFLVTARHLFHDWKKSDEPNSLSLSKRDIANLPYEMERVLNVVRDLCNGSKHFSLDYDNKLINAVLSGNEVGWFEHFFHENLPAVTVEVSWYFSIRILNNLTMGYFEWVFDDTCPVENFPNELLEAINYCNIAKRARGPSPPIWLRGIESAYQIK